MSKRTENRIIIGLALLSGILMGMLAWLGISGDAEGEDKPVATVHALRQARVFNEEQETLNAEYRAYQATLGSRCSCEMERP